MKVDMQLNKETKPINVSEPYHIYPNPPLGQDMTQDQSFLRGVLQILNSEFSFF